MNQPQATIIDTTQKDNYQKIGCQQQTLSSHDADWRSLIFEHYCQPAGEMPEVTFKHHTIVVFFATNCYGIKNGWALAKPNYS